MGRVMFWLGSHLPSWLERTDVPLFISNRRLAGRKRLPRARGPWALDSGGFSELSLFGSWQTSPAAYVTQARRYAGEIGGLSWAAIQDWMCEPHLVAKTGLSVAEHQRRTVASYLDLQQRAPDLPWVPVLQGWERGDYLRHAEQYTAAGVALDRLPLVGVGSVCRRQATADAAAVFRALWRAGLRVHGFGVKVQGLARAGVFLASADSMAWSFVARRLQRATCGVQTHQNCANCLTFALGWREDLVRSCAHLSGQLDLGLGLAA